MGRRNLHDVTLPRTVYSGKNALNNLKTVVAGAKKVADLH